MTNEPKEPKEQTKEELSEEQLEQVAGGTSDIGQKLQFQLQEANNVLSRSTKASSNIQKQAGATADALVKNIRG